MDWESQPRPKRPDAPRQPQNPVQLTKSSSLWRLHQALSAAREKNKSELLAATSRAVFRLRDDWEDLNAQGYTEAVLDLVNIEQDAALRKLLRCVLLSALSIARQRTNEFVEARATEINEQITALGVLSADIEYLGAADVGS